MFSTPFLSFFNNKGSYKINKHKFLLHFLFYHYICRKTNEKNYTLHKIISNNIKKRGLATSFSIYGEFL